MPSKRIPLTLAASLTVALLAATANAQSEVAKGRWAGNAKAEVQMNLQEPTVMGAEAQVKQDRSQAGVLGEREQQKRAIVGSWLLTVNAGGPPIKALASFTSDGIFLSAAQGDITTRPNAPSIAPIYGAWAYNGGRQFLTTHLELGYSVQTGELLGTLKLNQTITLNETGDEWQSTFRFTVFDPNGKELYSGTGTAQARRIQVEMDGELHFPHEEESIKFGDGKQ